MGMFFLSENVFVTAYNRLVFSITSLHGENNTAIRIKKHVVLWLLVYSPYGATGRHAPLQVALANK